MGHEAEIFRRRKNIVWKISVWGSFIMSFHDLLVAYFDYLMKEDDWSVVLVGNKCNYIQLNKPNLKVPDFILIDTWSYFSVFISPNWFYAMKFYFELQLDWNSTTLTYIEYWIMKWTCFCLEIIRCNLKCHLYLSMSRK